MTSTLIDLRGKLPDGMDDVYRVVQAVATELELEILVVGAMARDLVLVHGFNARLERGTRDIDFAVQVRDWASFAKLAEGLISKGFVRAENIAHRFYLKRENELTWEIDLVPFGELADSSGNIKWPPDESIEMSVLGFDEAFEHAFVVEMGNDSPSFKMRVVSPAGMSFLKLISWLERVPSMRTKDAQDIKYLMKSYYKIPDVFDRMYEEGDMKAEDWDQDRASARILGRDAANIIGQEALGFLQTSLLSNPDKLDLLLREMMPRFQEIEYEESLLKLFIEALRERC